MKIRRHPLKPMKISLKIVLNFWIVFFLLSCSEDKKLPILGNKELRKIDGKIDTVYHQIPDFTLLNQDSINFGSKELEGKIYVTDFFFTSCPTICPIMKTQLLRVYQKYHENGQVALVSISIDPNFDRPAILKDFSKKLKVDTRFWNFLTGDQAEIFNLGEKEFMVTAQKDEKELGGYLHSGAFILVDKNRRIRGVYDGTKEEAVNQLILDIQLLLDEK